MEKSFLSLLYEEAEIVNKMESIQNSLEFAVEKERRILEIPVECAMKAQDLNDTRLMVRAYTKDLETLKSALATVREEMREHLVMILST